jgi:hypothetical protein
VKGTQAVSYSQVFLFYKGSCIGFEVHIAVSMEGAVFWVVTPCSPVEIHQCFRVMYYCLKGRRVSRTRKNQAELCLPLILT